ncbi:retrovirus-related Pol polyprotein from transposon 17.6 [Trichonephila clavipes]|nr:retrovirus-related Pol polyprotein from transposon 17.6 [Trichonephila clavipes]
MERSIDPPKGHKYILCLVDQHTRWGEAVPLTSLSAKVTCEALLSIFSRTGIPNVVASDNGTNFAADLTKEFEKRIGSSPRFSTPGYPQSNGLVERFNRTLKNMLHNVVRDEGRGWHLQIPYVLWAYREIPHSTTGVSPFQLLYGRQPQGPLSILKSTWTGKHNNLQLCTTPVSKYLEDLKCKLEKAAEQAKLVSTVQQEKMAYYHNLRSSDKVFKVGEKVIVLIPDATSKLFARWQGPATIIEKRNPHSFLVEMPDNSTKHIHQNKLRHYVASSNSVNVIFEEEKEFGQVETPPTATEESKFYEVLNNLKTDNLNSYNLKVLKNLISKFKYIFTKPVQPARVGAHKIELVANAVRRKPHCYSVPMAYRREVERQVQELLDLNLIEPSEAEIAHPIVCVAKKDSSIRMCVDFRALNAVTKVPVFPMKDMQELIFTAGSAHWLTSIDLLKGYWQIKMDEISKPLTAFTTHNAVYQWKTMPFGLAGASGTFQREMNRILKSHSEYAQAYMDDVVIFSKTFEEHLVHLELVLTELEKLGFSVRLDKCSFAAKRIKYLGHTIGGGKHGPDEDKILTIKRLIRPTTKKEVRSVLGLMGFYRAYIPNYAEISTPLTELTKKNKPNNVSWGEAEQNSFVKLKELLCEVTSLATPDANLPFQVHCDASDYGVGCCLTQQDTEGIYRPIAFASQKFNATQINWASIEKEAWAVLYGLNKFDKWIYGAKVEIISDHNPLKYLNQTTPKSPKLTRWALALQRWNHSITHRPGIQHRSADALSRLR